jgi:hypothetical protein
MNLHEAHAHRNGLLRSLTSYRATIWALQDERRHAVAFPEKATRSLRSIDRDICADKIRMARLLKKLDQWTRLIVDMTYGPMDEEEEEPPSDE